MLLKGANLISDGSELLLEVMDPGLIGGLLLPILGALPDAAMIVVSGTGGSAVEAQDEVGGREGGREAECVHVCVYLRYALDWHD